MAAVADAADALGLRLVDTSSGRPLGVDLVGPLPRTSRSRSLHA